MQRRPILYIIAIALIILVVFNNNDQNQEQLLPVISREQIFEDFKNQTGEVWLNFPANFSGTSGELFYLGEQVKGEPVTKVYRIYRPESGEIYYDVHDQWDNVKLPENQFETHYLVEGEWIKNRK